MLFFQLIDKRFEKFTKNITNMMIERESILLEGIDSRFDVSKNDILNIKERIVKLETVTVIIKDINKLKLKN